MTDISAWYYTHMIYYLHGISTQYTHFTEKRYVYILYIYRCHANGWLNPTLIGFRKRHLGLDLRRVPGSRSCAPSPTGGESTRTGRGLGCWELHQLRLVVDPMIYQVVSASQIVQDF